MERIEARGQRDSSALHFVCEVLGSMENPPFEPGSGGVDVELRINGVEVPFADTIEKIYARALQDVDRRAAELVRSKADMSDLEDRLDQLKMRLNREIDDAFGVTTGWY